MKAFQLFNKTQTGELSKEEFLDVLLALDIDLETDPFKAQQVFPR